MRSLAPEVTPGPRSELLACVANVPGIHLRSIERETHLPLGQVLYHLDRLERMGLVTSVRDAGFRRYFLSHDVGRGEKRFLSALRGETSRRVLLHLLEARPLSHRDIQERVGVAASTLSFHLQRLVTTAVVTRERAGTQNLYSLADPDAVRRELIYYRESFRDPAVDRYVRAILDALPPLADATGGRTVPVKAS